MNHVLISKTGKPTYYTHVLIKSNCPFCKALPKIGRTKQKKKTIVLPTSPGYKFEITDRKVCVYHLVAEWLKQNPHVVYNTINFDDIPPA